MLVEVVKVVLAIYIIRGPPSLDALTNLRFTCDLSATSMEAADEAMHLEVTLELASAEQK